jgi:hypothetical protein
MRGGQGTRRRRARTRPALGRVSGRIGGSRTVVACITRRGWRDAVDPQRVHCSDLRIRHSQVAEPGIRPRELTDFPHPCRALPAFAQLYGPCVARCSFVHTRSGQLGWRGGRTRRTFPITSGACRPVERRRMQP